GAVYDRAQSRPCIPLRNEKSCAVIDRAYSGANRGRLIAMQPEPSHGLSDAEAARRLTDEGPNELPSSRPKSNLAVVRDVLREPMFLLLLATGVVYLILGSLEEAIALSGAILVVIGITVYQERKTERTLQALRDLSSPRALVIRDGIRKRIPGR